jgi:hypothetical protein
MNMADDTLFVACATIVSVLEVSKYIDENGVVVEPVFEEVGESLL